MRPSIAVDSDERLSHVTECVGPISNCQSRKVPYAITIIRTGRQSTASGRLGGAPDTIEPRALFRPSRYRRWPRDLDISRARGDDVPDRRGVQGSWAPAW